MININMNVSIKMIIMTKVKLEKLKCASHVLLNYPWTAGKKNSWQLDNRWILWLFVVSKTSQIYPIHNSKWVSIYSRFEEYAEQHIMFSLDQTIVVQPVEMPEERRGRGGGREAGRTEGGGAKFAQYPPSCVPKLAAMLNIHNWFNECQMEPDLSGSEAVIEFQRVIVLWAAFYQSGPIRCW